jgi:hypothetical protein
MMMVIVFASGLTISVYAATRVSQTSPGCATYQSNLAVIRVDSVPHIPTGTPIGATVVTTFHVVYPDGSPVVLQPQTASFLWVGTVGQREFDNVPVTYTGTPGFYTYTATLTQDIVQATGQGVITITVITCSCQDQLGNRGPVGNVNSLITSDPSDNSQEQVGQMSTSTTMVTATQPVFATEDVILLIAALLIIALLLLVARSRRKSNP